jgi:hypothetical protein
MSVHVHSDIAIERLIDTVFAYVSIRESSEEMIVDLLEIKRWCHEKALDTIYERPKSTYLLKGVSDSHYSDG